MRIYRESLLKLSIGCHPDSGPDMHALGAAIELTQSKQELLLLPVLCFPESNPPNSMVR